MRSEADRGGSEIERIERKKGKVTDATEKEKGGG